MSENKDAIPRFFLMVGKRIEEFNSALATIAGNRLRDSIDVTRSDARHHGFILCLSAEVVRFDKYSRLDDILRTGLQVVSRKLLQSDCRSMTRFTVRVLDVHKCESDLIMKIEISSQAQYSSEG